jgi:hypothetical protein
MRLTLRLFKGDKRWSPNPCDGGKVIFYTDPTEIESEEFVEP